MRDPSADISDHIWRTKYRHPAKDDKRRHIMK
jgi:hypothetical protein